jgi:MFS family permease
MSGAATAGSQPSSRRRLPAFIRGVVEDRAALRTLVAASTAIAAVGLDPHILDPGMPNVRAALKAEPDLQSLFMLAAVVQSGFVLLGGLLADAFRSVRLVRAALCGLVATSLLAVLVPSGPGLIAIRFVAWGFGGLVLPFAIGAVATSYGRAARATALGVAYAVLGAATAAAPALALALGPGGPRWPAFAACAVASLLAIGVSRHLPDLAAARREHRRGILAVALFAFGVVALAAGFIGVSDALDPLRLLIDGAGILAVAVALWLRASSLARHDAIRVEFRPVAVAIAAGVVIGFAQAAPMLHLPIFFQLIQGVPPLLASIAVAPFVAALLVAGPVSGWLLARYSPRLLIAGGVLAVALADLLVALVIGRTTPYLAFILPFILIGTGFVIATTVRTAVIFASVPKEMPASAAALNEASLGVGSRLGVVVATVVMARVALETYGDQYAGLPSHMVERFVAPFREFVTLIGLPHVEQLIGGLGPAIAHAYENAVVAGMRMSEIVPGVVALVASLVVFVAMGRRDPVKSVWDLADERGDDAGSETTPDPS